MALRSVKCGVEALRARWDCICGRRFCKGRVSFFQEMIGEGSANCRAKVSTHVFVPEAQRRLAGGEAQRNHRNQRRNIFPAPEGRQTKVGLSPLRGWEYVFDCARWFLHRLISGVPPGRRVSPDLCRNFSSTVRAPLADQLLNGRSDCLISPTRNNDPQTQINPRRGVIRNASFKASPVSSMRITS